MPGGRRRPRPLSDIPAPARRQRRDRPHLCWHRPCCIPFGSMERIRIEQHGAMGGLWFAGWLFTIGYLHLAFWRAVLAVVLWPYYLGVAISALAR
jgi:hypothetical protein